MYHTRKHLCFRVSTFQLGRLLVSFVIFKTREPAIGVSLCCMAARPHGSHAASREWSMDPHELYWQTNTSFSPPPSRWDLDFQPEGPQYGFNDGIQLYGSSTSSNRKESKSWVRGNQLYHQPYSDGAGMFLSSSSQLSQGPQWTPPAIQEICVDEFEFPKRREVIYV